MWCITPMPCVTHVTLWVFTLSGSPHRLAGWWWCLLGCGGGVSLCCVLGVCAGASLCRGGVGWAVRLSAGAVGWVSAWGVIVGLYGGFICLAWCCLPRYCGCAFIGALMGLSRVLLRVCYTKGLQGLLNGFIWACTGVCAGLSLVGVCGVSEGL